MGAGRAVAVVVADRSGDGPDPLAPVLGVPALVRAIRGLLASGAVGEVAVVVRPRTCRAAVRVLDGLPVGVYPDARAAVDAVARSRADGSAILLHDAARALAPPLLAGAVSRAVDDGADVAVPVLALADTVKRVGLDGLVTAGPDRTVLRVVQTPQAYRPDLLTDDLLHRVLVDGPVGHAWAAVGVPVATVPGHPLAFAVRTAWDRELAEMLAEDPVRVAP